MRDIESDPGWAQRLKERRVQRYGSDRIVRWIATPASPKRRVGGRNLEEAASDNVVVLATRMAS